MIIPKKRSLYRYAVDVFVELLNKVQDRYKPYRCNDQDVNSWNKFVTYWENLNTFIDKDFIKKFADYGIQTWFNPSVDEIHRHSVRFSWIFGEAQIKRYRKFDAKTNASIVRNCIKKETDLKIKDDNNQLKSLYLTVRPLEEKFKKEFFNTKRGLSWCIANTSLYFHKSSYCASCNAKVECKDILKNNYSKIYKLRGYDN